MKRIVFLGKGLIEVEDAPSLPLGPDQVRIKTKVTLMSTGTEGTVLNRWFAEGTHWDQWVKYPFLPGYLAISEVVETGSQISGIEMGTRVASRTSHASDQVVSPDKLFRVPPSVSDEDAVWFGLAKIAFVGARVADYRLGSKVLILGAGPIGQLSVRWAAAAGCARVVVVDPLEARLGLSKTGGADEVISASASQASERVKRAFGGDLPDVVIDSTGNGQVFAAAQSLVADRGTIVLLGDPGDPSQQRLTSDVITRGLRVIGAHDMHVRDDGPIVQLFFDFVTRSRIRMDGMISHRFPVSQAIDAYRLATERREDTMGILFNW